MKSLCKFLVILTLFIMPALSRAELTTDMDLSLADVSFIGENSMDNSGTSITSAGDVNGDGKDDILIGAYENDDGGSDAGKSYLFFGNSIALGGVFDLSTADATFVGEDDYDFSGRSVSSAGDIDNDGLDDILIGAYDANNRIGRVYIYFGNTIASGGSFSLSSADIIIEGEQLGDAFGHTVASAGYIDRDHKSDIIIWAPGNDEGGSYSGKGYIFLGRTISGGGSFNATDARTTFIGENPTGSCVDEWYGGYYDKNITSLGDIDGDNRSEIVIGVPTANGDVACAGKIYLFFGSTVAGGGSLMMANADASFVGESIGDNAGSSVSSVEDINGDGKNDLLIGAPYANNHSGRAYLFLGSTISIGGSFNLSVADISISGTDFETLGWSVSSGDVDNDGVSDILAGALNNDNDHGKTYLFSGSSLAEGGSFSSIDAEASFIGENDQDQSGNSVSLAGDFNDDGKNDILIGARDNNDGGGAAGKTYLIFGDLIETCDGLDNDLDGDIDEGLLTTFYQDADSDGYGDPSNSDQACDSSTSTVTNPVTDSSDCADSSSLIYPSATEVCGDSVDQDCDGADTACPEETETVTEEEPVIEEADEEDPEVIEESVVEEEVVEEEVVEVEEEIVEDEGTAIESTGDSNLNGGGCGCDFGTSQKLNTNQVILMLLSAFPIMIMASIRRRIKYGYFF